MAKMAKDLQGLAIQIGHLHDGAILLLRPQPFRFSFHIQIWWSQRGLNNKSLNLHKKANRWRILVLVVKWRHHANGQLDAKCVPLESGNFGDFRENGKFLPEVWPFNLEGESAPLASGDFCEIGDFGENGKIWHKWRYPECGRYSSGCQVAPWN